MTPHYNDFITQVLATLKVRATGTGTPATGTITFNERPAPAAGDTITVNGVAYTLGAALGVVNGFFSAYASYGLNNTVGAGNAALSGLHYKAHIAARSFAAAINAFPDLLGDEHTANNPVASGCVAITYGTLVRLFAINPGTGANTLTLATSNAVAFTLSGATLAGGA